MSVSCYEVAQICMNGHVITPFLKTNPIHSQKYCSQCGALTITTCVFNPRLFMFIPYGEKEIISVALKSLEVVKHPISIMKYRMADFFLKNRDNAVYALLRNNLFAGSDFYEVRWIIMLK